MTGLLVMAFVGLIAQLVDGSLGMAYGVTSTSLLLAHGLSPAAASASVHLAEMGTTFMSGVAHWRVGNIDRRVFVRIAVPGAIGAFLGAVLLSTVSLEAATPVTSGVLLALGVYVMVRFSRSGRRAPRGRSYVRGRHLAAIGGVAGFVDASSGGGWGPIATPTLLATGKMEPRMVIGSVSAAEFAVASAATLGFGAALGVSGISWLAVTGLLIGGAVAAPIAALVVRRVVPDVLGVGVGGLIVLTNTRTLLVVFESPLLTPLLLGLTCVWLAWLTVVVLRRRRAGIESNASPAAV